MAIGKTVVIGSINQDIVAMAKRHPKPGETVMGSSLAVIPGGKGANQAVAAAAAGSPVTLVSATGRDAAGAQLVRFLADSGVNVEAVTTVDNAPTGTAIITVDESGENAIVVIPGANATVTDNPLVVLSGDDVVLAQFEVPVESVEAMFERARWSGARTILNPSPMREIDAALLALTDILVINETELATIGAGAPDRGEIHANDRLAIIELAHQINAKQCHGNSTIVVTLGAAGVVTSGKLGDVDIAGIQVEAVDTTGAGDCFAGSLAAELAAGSTFANAVTYANKAAAICVTRPGAAPSIPLRSEVVSRA